MDAEDGAGPDADAEPEDASSSAAAPPSSSSFAATTASGRYAVVFGYVGEAYQGLQKNPGARTIEEALETALFRAGGITPENYGSLAKVGWNRAARTDKGVHAAAQVISLLLHLRVGDSPDAMRERVNAALPLDIRVIDIVRVTKQFNSKNLCSSRRYGYVLPTFTLRPEALSVLSMHIARAHRHADQVLAVDPHMPGRGHIQACHDAHQAGFTGLGGPQQNGHVRGLRGQTHVVQPGLGPDFFADSF
jgi:tRNA U38,U39,U40 pseudouridine synthase TruA